MIRSKQYYFMDTVHRFLAALEVFDVTSLQCKYNEDP